MATLYVTECTQLGQDKYGNEIAAPLVGSAASVTEQTVAIGGSSAASAAFGSRTRFIIVHTDAICSIAFGVSPVAAASAHRLAANETRFYGVNPGDAIAVITNT